MGPHSRLLVQEYILQNTDDLADNQPALFQKAPEPLLPNFGEGRIRQYALDIHLMVACNSMGTRTLSDFIRLGNESGLHFERVWDLGDMGAMEYRLPKTRRYA